MGRALVEKFNLVHGQLQKSREKLWKRVRLRGVRRYRESVTGNEDYEETFTS